MMMADVQDWVGPITQMLCKTLLALYLLASYWLKQVTWLSTESKGRAGHPLHTGRLLQNPVKKRMDTEWGRSGDIIIPTTAPE